MAMKRRVISFLLALVMVLGMLPVTGGVEVAEAATYEAQKVVDIAVGYANSGATSWYNLCLAFVRHCFNEAYGFSSSACCAYTYGTQYIDEKSKDNIPLGADVFFGGSGIICDSCGNEAGHVGIYIGDGKIVHAWGSKPVRITTIDAVINSGQPYRGWGWHGNVELNTNPLIKDELPTYCDIKTTAATNIMTQPCSNGTDASSTVLEEVSKGKTKTAYKLVLNKVGNYWYEVRTSDGTVGYIPSAKVSWVKDLSDIKELTDIKITGETNPPDQEVGDAHWIQGTVSATYSGLTDVSAYVYDTSGTERIGSMDSVSGNSYSLYKSNVDNKTLFNKLTPGSYTFVVRGYYKNYYAVDEKTAGYHTGEVIVQQSEFRVVEDNVLDYLPSMPTVSGMKSTYTVGEEIVFKWNSTTNTTHYNIWLEKKNSSGEYVKDEHITYVNSGHSITRGAGEYCAVVQAYNSNKWWPDGSDWLYAQSDWVYFTVKPAAPTVTASNNASTGKPVLKWAAVTGAEKYEIWRSTSETGTYSRIYTATSTQFTNTSVAAGETYYYKVRAVAGDVYGDFSAPIGRTCDCAAPVLTASNNTKNGNIVLSWAPVDGADKYKLYRADSKDGTYSSIWTSTSTTFSNPITVTNTKNLEDGKTYYYKVRAYISTNEYATSAYSNVAEGTYTHIHTLVTDKAVAATCTTAGKTEGKHCSACGAVTVAQKTIAAKGHSFSNGTCTVCGAKDPNYVAGLTGVTRIFGADRYETAFKTAEVLKQQLGVEKFDNIVVACGDNFADALGGSYLAAKKNAPILLVKSSKIDAVKSYIKANLNPGGTVYLLGGTAAIPAAMDTGLDGFNVKRLAGATRYDTNLLILQEAGVTNEDILICTGKNFADSLSAAAAGRPILLVKDSLNDSQKAFLQSHAANKKYILGGTAAVSTSVENQAKAYGTVERIGGNTRYETSVLIAKEFFPDATQAALAYAQNFPDGLSGGALAYAMKAPLVLTASGKEAAAAAYAKEQGITSGVILGGNVLISDKAVRTIFQMQSGDVIKIG